MTEQEHIDEQIVTALRRIIRAIDLHSRDLLQQYGLTAPQLMTVREVGRLQPVSTGALAEAVHVSQATMTGILDRLERQGLISRIRDQDDRRSVTITLTEEGKKFLPSAPSLLQDRFRAELSRLAIWEQTNILSALQRIATMMGAEDLSAAPILTSGAEPLAAPNSTPHPDGKDKTDKRRRVNRAEVAQSRGN